jgi:hypothetical protein
LEEEMTNLSRHNILTCSKCGPFVKAFCEVWQEGQDSPYKFELLEYNDRGKIELYEKVKLKKKSGWGKKRLYFCGNCSRSISFRNIKAFTKPHRVLKRLKIK